MLIEAHPVKLLELAKMENKVKKIIGRKHWTRELVSLLWLMNMVREELK